MNIPTPQDPLGLRMRDRRYAATYEEYLAELSLRAGKAKPRRSVISVPETDVRSVTPRDTTATAS